MYGDEPFINSLFIVSCSLLSERMPLALIYMYALWHRLVPDPVPNGRHSANRKIHRPSVPHLVPAREAVRPTAGTIAGTPAVPCAKKESWREKASQLYWLQSSAGAAAERELQSVAGCAKTGRSIESLPGLGFQLCRPRIIGDYGCRPPCLG
jgi:hypothetical protein